MQISCAVTAQLISAFVFAIRKVQSLYYLNPKIQASSHLLWLYSPVCVGPGWKPQRPVFSQQSSLNMLVVACGRWMVFFRFSSFLLQVRPQTATLEPLRFLCTCNQKQNILLSHRPLSYPVFECVIHNYELHTNLLVLKQISFKISINS